MKTTILKMFALPLAAFALASAGAVSTNESSKSKTDSPLIIGYIHVPTADSCEPVNVDCSLGAGPTCLSSGFTAFEKNSQGKCIVQLHRNN